MNDAMKNDEEGARTEWHKHKGDPSKIPHGEKRKRGTMTNVPRSNHSTYRLFVPPHLLLIHDTRYSSHINMGWMRDRMGGIRRVWSRDRSLRIPSRTSRILSVGLNNRLEPRPIHQYLVVLFRPNFMTCTYTRRVTEKVPEGQ